MKQIEKQIIEAMHALEREARTFDEVTGTKGVDEFRSTRWSPFGGPVNTKAVELYAQAKRAVETMGAKPETLREIQRLIEEAKKARPVDDQTHSVEEEQQRQAERRKEVEALDERHTRMVEAANRARSKAPAWAKRAIIAEYHVDKCDPRTDYFATEIEKRLLIGWRSGIREDFSQMRAAAQTQPETAHLVSRQYERREKYAWGSGYTLRQAESRYSSGWVVRAISKGDLDSIEFEDRTPKPTIIGDHEGVLVRQNEEKNGVEIMFPCKPKAAILDELHEYGFRWRRWDKYWWARRDERTLRFAESLAGKKTEEIV